MKTKFLIVVSCAFAVQTYGGSATWNAHPGTTNWNTASNWTPATIPNGPADTASFGVSSKTKLSFSPSILVNGIVFNAGAGAYTISSTTAVLTMSGTGVTNNSGVTQNFVAYTDRVGNAGYFIFTNNATSGESVSYNMQGATTFDALGSEAKFLDHSSAVFSTIISNGATVNGAFGAEVHFLDQSSASRATLIAVSAPVDDGGGGVLDFEDDSSLSDSSVVVEGAAVPGNGSPGFTYGTSVAMVDTTVTTDGGTSADSLGGFAVLTTPGAQGSTFISNGGAASNAGGGLTIFSETFDTGDSILTANAGQNGGQGGVLSLRDSSVLNGRVELFGNGTLDISQHAAPGISVGSLEGDGGVNLGGLNLTVGSSALSTTFAGTIQGTAGSSLTKTGTGTLSLTGSTTFAGGTTVAAGTLGGNGTIAGALTIGTGSGAGASVAPAAGGAIPMTLTTQSALTFKADGTYTCTLSTKRKQSDQVVALGITIDSAAQFKLQALAKKRLATEQTFVVLNNTSSTPISGTFANLADGSTLKSGNNKFQASYEGGDGNDLTLTVVP